MDLPEAAWQSVGLRHRSPELLMRKGRTPMRSLRRGRIVPISLVTLAVGTFCTGIPLGAQTVHRGNLVVNVSATPEPAGGGSQVSYTVNVKDDSIHTATGVTVTMDLPDGAQFLRCTPATQV